VLDVSLPTPGRRSRLADPPDERSAAPDSATLVVPRAPPPASPDSGVGTPSVSRPRTLVRRLGRVAWTSTRQRNEGAAAMPLEHRSALPRCSPTFRLRWHACGTRGRQGRRSGRQSGVRRLASPEPRYGPRRWLPARQPRGVPPAVALTLPRDMTMACAVVGAARWRCATPHGPTPIGTAPRPETTDRGTGGHRDRARRARSRRGNGTGRLGAGHRPSAQSPRTDHGTDADDVPER